MCAEDNERAQSVIMTENTELKARIAQLEMALKGESPPDGPAPDTPKHVSRLKPGESSLKACALPCSSLETCLYTGVERFCGDKC